VNDTLTRLLAALEDHGFQGPYGFADSREFLRGPDDPPPGPERDAALAALREADAKAEQHREQSFLAALEQAQVQVVDRS
jgi:hypothetical protein